MSWFKNAIIYQAHVRAFFDSDDDGIGDFAGLTEKLGYVEDLGCTAIWLLPFYPSPLRDGGYDIADYRDINPAYGTLADFDRFVQEAHRRNIRVITELVLNHTSDQHPWFQAARRAPPGSPEREFYVWNDTADKYKGTRIIFRDFETSNWTWDETAKAYYWHRFYSHQPDLNWDNPAVEAAMHENVRFWLDKGVDGLRLDAVPYLYQREGTSCENLPETHQALKRLRTFVDDNFEDRMLLAEANQWPEDSVEYFGDGDECQMAFHFPVMPRLFMAVQTADRFPLIDIIEQTPDIPDDCQWAMFLRNHDELTLEMVTDEERDYMYKTYAGEQRARINLGIRRRLAPLLSNHRPQIELLNALLFAFNGTPIVYYGDEIGMGDNIYLGDRDGVRTPMQWTQDRNAGFSQVNPQKLYLPVNIDPEYRYEAVNVEAQQQNSTSLWWWMKRLIGMRRKLDVLGNGSIEFLYPENPKILAFIRKHGDQELLVVANLGNTVEFCELNLDRYEGRQPLEVFGRTRFPRVGQLPYLLTLGAYAIYWLDMSPRRERSPEEGLHTPPAILFEGPWRDLVGKSAEQLTPVLPDVIRPRRWFAGKSKVIDEVTISDVVPLDDEAGPVLAILDVRYERADPEKYGMLLAVIEGAEAERYLAEHSWAALVRIDRQDGPVRLLIDALDLDDVRDELLSAIETERSWRGAKGRLVGSKTRAYEALRGEEALGSHLPRADQSNTSVMYDQQLVLKTFRRLATGENPEMELGRHLTEATGLTSVPRLAGGLTYRPSSGDPVSIAALQEFVPNQGDAFRHAVDTLSRRLDHVLAGEEPGLSDSGHLESMRLLGQRVGELHHALATSTGQPGIDPEVYTPHAQRGLYQSMRTQAVRTLDLLAKAKDALPAPAREKVERLLAARNQLLEIVKQLLSVDLTSTRIRVHGDLHLGQVLFTGRDFVIVDFEGEPMRPIGERRIKRSPYRDVAGMVRSFDYVVGAVLRDKLATGTVNRPSEAFDRLEHAGRSWRAAVERAFLDGYEAQAEPAGLLPTSPEERAVLMRCHLVEKAVYELSYEMNNRPDWLELPLDALLETIDAR